MTMFNRQQELVSMDLREVPPPEQLPFVFINLFRTSLSRNVFRVLRKRNLDTHESFEDFLTSYYSDVGKITDLDLRKALHAIPRERVIMEAVRTWKAYRAILSDGTSPSKNVVLSEFIAKKTVYHKLPMTYVERPECAYLTTVFCDWGYAHLLPHPLDLAPGPVEVSVDSVRSGELEALMIEGYVNYPFALETHESITN